jgi:hypothetical protein
MDSALNTPFYDWGNILFNTTIATAIADRLVENSEILLLGGEVWASPAKTPIHRPSNRRAAPSRRRAVMITRPEESAG